MAEVSYFWETTTGTGDSNTSGYSDTTFFQTMRSLFSRTANLGGVSPDYLNELAVTGTATPVAVNTGAALVYGIPYHNSASVNVAVASPVASTRIDRIVLRASWAAETVRITRIAGVEGGSAPAMVQTPGTTWDIPLATVSITTGGVITVTDAREWLGGIGDNTADNSKFAQAAAGTMKGNFTGSTANLTDTSVPTVLAQYIHAATSKATPVAADELALIDSAASNVLKKTPASNMGFGNPTAFTPSLTGTTSSAGITHSSQVGYYTKIGQVVFFTINLTISSKGSASGSIRIAGLPVAANANGTYLAYTTWVTTSKTYVNLFGLVIASDTVIELRHADTATVNLFGNILDAVQIDNSSQFVLSGWYVSA